MLLCSLGHLDIRYEPGRFLLGVEVCHARLLSLMPSRVGGIRQHSVGLGTFVTSSRTFRLHLMALWNQNIQVGTFHQTYCEKIVIELAHQSPNHCLSHSQPQNRCNTVLVCLLAGYPTWSLERWGYCPSWWVCLCLRYVWTHTTPGSSPTMVSHSTFFTNHNSTDSSTLCSLPNSANIFSCLTVYP